MGQKKSRHSAIPLLDSNSLRRITAATSFLPDEIQYFYYDFLQYTPNGYLTVNHFEEFYQSLFLRGNPENFARYVFETYDTNRDGIVDFEEFITGLYYTTKASPIEKLRWAFNLCDISGDRQLDASELEGVISALYELSDADMARIETYEEALEHVKQLFLENPDDITHSRLQQGITEDEFVDLFQKNPTVMKLIDCRPLVNKRSTTFDNSARNSTKKQLKFKPSMHKSLSDSTLAAKQTTD